VELLSGGKDEAMGEMRGILKGASQFSHCVAFRPSRQLDLMAENQTLRNLLKGLSSFIGDGAGGFLPKLGWDMAEFNSFVNRSETDTAWESFQKHKKSVGPSAGQADKRLAEDDMSSGRAKRPRGQRGQEKDSGGPDYSLLGPLSTSVPTNPGYPLSARGAPHETGLFSELVRGSAGSPMLMPSSPASAPFGGAAASKVTGYQPSYMHPTNLNVDTSLPPVPYASDANSQTSAQPHTSNILNAEQPEDDGDPKKEEAFKLVRYEPCIPESPVASFLCTWTVATILTTTRGIVHIVFHPLCGPL
jgi:hypothetical protein